MLDKTLKLPMVLGHKIVHQLPRYKDAYLVRRLSGKTCQRRRNGQSLNTTDWHHALKRPSITTQDTQNIVIKIFVYNPNMKPLFNISAFVLSRLDYCNSVLAGLPHSTIRPLQRVLNAAARLVAGPVSYTHLTLPTIYSV